MKIDNECMNGVASPAARSAEVERTHRLDRYRQQESPSLANDQVSISGLASNVLKASEAHASQQSARVQALAAAYRTGRYVVDPRQVSSKVVDAWLAGSSKPEK